MARPGHRVIIAAYAALGPEEIAGHHPTVVLVDAANRVREIHREILAGTEVPA